MKKICFNLILEFSSDFESTNKSEKEMVEEVALNVIEAINDYANTNGIAPADGNSYTKKIVISEPENNISLQRNYF